MAWLQNKVDQQMSDSDDQDDDDDDDDDDDQDDSDDDDEEDQDSKVTTNIQLQIFQRQMFILL